LGDPEAVARSLLAFASTAPDPVPLLDAARLLLKQVEDARTDDVKKARLA
jgi:hypothetical protein